MGSVAFCCHASFTRTGFRVHAISIHIKRGCRHFCLCAALCGWLSVMPPAEHLTTLSVSIPSKTGKSCVCDLRLWLQMYERCVVWRAKAPSANWLRTAASARFKKTCAARVMLRDNKEKIRYSEREVIENRGEIAELFVISDKLLSTMHVLKQTRNKNCI